MAAKSNRTKIQNDLLRQLKSKGGNTAAYEDLVKDYMSLWDTKNELNKDIKQRGVMVPYESNAGIVNIKKNESVGELIKVSAQMTKLLAYLGLSPAMEDGDDDDIDL